MMVFLRALRNIGDSSLLYASFRMTWFYFYSRLGIWIIFETQRFLFLNCFLSELSWRNSFALKRGGNCIYSITKFTESRWNDSVFEGSEEHWNSKSGDFAQQCFFFKLSYWCFESIIFVKVFVYLIEATCTLNLQNPKNGSKIPYRDFANPPNRDARLY